MVVVHNLVLVLDTDFATGVDYRLKNNNVYEDFNIKMWFALATKAMRLPEIFDSRLFPIAESQKFSKSETGPK